MNQDVFENSATLAQWASLTLSRQGIDNLAKWRMLEYWIQLELYRSIEAGEAGKWRYLGEYEQPYYTEMPCPGAKTNIKWADMVLYEPSLKGTDRIVWIELKDVGRNESRYIDNLKGIGRDLAALYKLRTDKTKEEWLNPSPSVIDQGRTLEWKNHAPLLGVKNHLIAQIVIVPSNKLDNFGEDRAPEIWLDVFEKRAKLTGYNHGIKLEKTINGAFTTFATVTPLPENCPMN